MHYALFGERYMRLRFNKKALHIAMAATIFGGLFVYSSAPVNSVSNVVLNGSANSTLSLTAGDAAQSTLTSAPGIADGTFAPVATDTADGFTDTVNFGTLTNGDGTNSVARVAFRERGNTPCHVSCSVSAYTANNISYNGAALTGASAAELTFVQLGNGGGASAGANGSTAGFGYGARFTSGTDTLATLNGGTMGGVVTTSDKFVSFTSKPSLAGGLSSADNYVEEYATFSVPTGFIWATNGAAPNNWSSTVQFAIFTGP
jgi:hypothetical protein